MTQIVKSGYLKRHSKSMFSGGWQTVWVILYSDSNLVIYKRQGDNEVKGKVHMKEVAKRFAYGTYTDGMEGRPQIPSGASYSQMLAVPLRNNSKAKIYWFLTNSEAELNEWMAAICSTLPPPPTHHAQKPQQPPSQAHIQPVSAQQTHSQYPAQPQPSYGGAPPPYSAAPPAPGGIGFDGLAGGGYPQQPPPGSSPYPQAPYPAQPGPYPQQPGYAPPPPVAQPYPTQQYAPPQAYPQQHYQQPYQQPGYAPQPGYGYQQPQQQPQVVYVQQGSKKKSGGLGGLGGGNTAKLAAGLIGGAALGYGASRMMGGGFGGWGFGRHGSWSSLSSFGSCGSFGSFGSFD